MSKIDPVLTSPLIHKVDLTSPHSIWTDEVVETELFPFPRKLLFQQETDLGMLLAELRIEYCDLYSMEESESMDTSSSSILRGYCTSGSMVFFDVSNLFIYNMPKEVTDRMEDDPPSFFMNSYDQEKDIWVTNSLRPLWKKALDTDTMFLQLGDKYGGSIFSFQCKMDAEVLRMIADRNQFPINTDVKHLIQFDFSHHGIPEHHLGLIKTWKSKPKYNLLGKRYRSFNKSRGLNIIEIFNSTKEEEKEKVNDGDNLKKKKRNK